MTECGHGYRSLKWEGPNWAKRTAQHVDGKHCGRHAELR